MKTETASARIQRVIQEWADCRPEHSEDYVGAPIEIQCAGKPLALDHPINSASKFPCNNAYGVRATWPSGAAIEFLPGFRRFVRP